MITLFIAPGTPQEPGKRKFTCRIDELPVLAEFIIESMNRDLSDFIAEYPELNEDYLSDFRKKRTEVLGLLRPKKITSDLKEVTQRIEKNLDGMRKHLTKLEVSVRLADKNEEITMSYKDFGMKFVRQAIKNGDVEQFDGTMLYLKQNITQQYAALSHHGYSDAKRDALYKLWDKIMEDNALQNQHLDSRDSLVEKNIHVFNELWEIMTEVCFAGKSIYQTDFPARADEYTIAELINRIRQEGPKPRYRSLILAPNETRVITNVIIGSTATNTGKTVIKLWNGTGIPPADAPELDIDNSMPIPLSWSSTISVYNLSPDKSGKIRVYAIGGSV